MIFSFLFLSVMVCSVPSRNVWPKLPAIVQHRPELQGASLLPTGPLRLLLRQRLVREPLWKGLAPPVIFADGFCSLHVALVVCHANASLSPHCQPVIATCTGRTASWAVSARTGEFATDSAVVIVPRGGEDTSVKNQVSHSFHMNPSFSSSTM